MKNPFSPEPIGRNQDIFGRDPDVRVVWSNLIATPWTVLIGPSGVGKSSLLRSGICRHPSERHRLVYVDAAEPSSNGDDLRKRVCHERGIEQESSLIDLVGHQPGMLLLLIDHFEEILGNSDKNDRRFLADLLDLPRCHICVSLREDEVARLDWLREAGIDAFSNIVKLDGLDWDAAREVMTRPLEGVDVDIDGARRIWEALADPGDPVVDTAMLALACDACFESRGEDVLYRGGRVPLQQYCEDALNSTYAWLLIRLVEQGDTGLTTQELQEASDGYYSAEKLSELDRLVKKRVLDIRSDSTRRSKVFRIRHRLLVDPVREYAWQPGAAAEEIQKVELWIANRRDQSAESLKRLKDEARLARVRESFYEGVRALRGSDEDALESGKAMARLFRLDLHLMKDLELQMLFRQVCARAWRRQKWPAAHGKIGTEPGGWMGAGITAREIWNNLEDRVIVTLDDQGCTWVWDRDRKDFVMYEMAMPNLAEVWRRRFADLVAAVDPVREKRDAEPIDDLVFQVGDF